MRWAMFLHGGLVKRLKPTSMGATPSSAGSPVCQIDGLELIGRGFTSDVYAFGANRVVKLFHGSLDEGRAEREFRVSQAVHAAGLPAPAVYELVKIEGRRAIVFERLEGESMFSRVQARPWTLFAAARQLAELHAEIHSIAAPPELPAQRDLVAGKIDAATHLSADEKQRAHLCLDSLPAGETLCHGDFHPANILLSARGPVIIDWEGASRGDPWGDVACTARLFQKANLPPWSPLYAHLLLKISRSLLHRT
jgi:uncharacterized protein (TIGR02172 family)